MDTGTFPLKKMQRRMKWNVNQSVIRAVAAVVPQGKSIIDLGAGSGRYVRALRELGYEADGVDGGEDVERLTDGLVKSVDLTGDCCSLHRAYNWGLFFEVGEHVPRELEERLIDTLWEIPKDGIIVSWAIPGQTGYGHVNCRLPSYIAGEFAQRGWQLDEELTLKARSVIARRYRRKIMVFR